MSVWFEFESDEDALALEEEVYPSFVTLDAIKGAEGLAREEGKVWMMLTSEERAHYERLMCEALVAMGGTHV